MLGENFVYFFTVQGFFVGIIFGILKSFDAEGLLVYTFFITTFFYLFSHIIIALYFRTLTAKPKLLLFIPTFAKAFLSGIIRASGKRSSIEGTGRT